MTLGQKIKKLRVEQGLTQKDLADQLHVTFQTISKWENDENEPDVSTLRELSRIFDCSIDYLVSEDETELDEEKEEPIQNVSPVEQVTKTIIIHQKNLHVCQRCNKDIPEDQLHVEQLYRTERHGRTSSRVYAGESFYHNDCWLEVCQEREAARQRAIQERAARCKKISFGWSIAGGTVALIASLLIFILACRQYIHPAISVLLSILVSYDIFAMLYCIITGSYIADVFVWCATRSVRFPGIIFSWSPEGFAWLIIFKILFAVLGFLIGLFFLAFAIVLSSLLASISFPFVLIKNIKTNYEDCL